MFQRVVHHLASPYERLPVTIVPGAGLASFDLIGVGGRDRSKVRNGVWDARGPIDPPRSAAAVFNVVPPSPQMYERVWRKGAAGRFAGRDLPLSEELTHLAWAVGDVADRFVIDVGCSEAMYSRFLAKRGARVLALDYSPGYLRQARKRCRHEGIDVALARAVAQHLPVLNAQADTVVIGGTLNEIGDVADALGEAARVLRPGGTLFSMSLTAATGGRGRALQRSLKPLGFTFPTADETVSLLVGAGFTVVDTRHEGVLLRIAARRD